MYIHTKRRNDIELKYANTCPKEMNVTGDNFQGMTKDHNGKTIETIYCHEHEHVPQLETRRTPKYEPWQIRCEGKKLAQGRQRISLS